MTSEPITYLNGEFLPFSEARLSLHDAGLVFGAIITDRCRTFRGQCFRLREHLSRFRQSCSLGHVPLEKSDQELTLIVEEILTRTAFVFKKEGDLSIIFLATPGTLGSFAGLDENGPPTLVVYAIPLQVKRYRSLFTQGAALLFSPALIDPEVIDPRIKHRSRLHWWIADQELLRTPGKNESALFVTSSTPSYVRETSIANFLAVIDGQVISPPRSQILNGVSLQVVEELCVSLSIPFREREISIEEVLRATTECLLTNSAFGIAGVSTIQSRRKFWPGETYQRLLGAYSKLVGVDLAEQILNE